jgi:peptidyl-prolyl cis-trans isomerase SurA
VHDRVPLDGLKRVAHIFVRWGPAYEAKSEEEAKKRIEEVYYKLQAGESWEKLAAMYSDDPLTRNRGGDLGYGRLMLELDSVRRQLKEGEYSKPFRSAQGWHILKVTEVKRYADANEKRNEFKILLQNNERSNLTHSSLIAKLKKEYQFKVNDTLIQFLKDQVGVRYYSQAYVLDSFPPSIQEAPLITFANQSYPFKAFWTHKLNQRRLVNQSQSLEQVIRSDVEKWGEQLLLDYEKTQLKRKYKDYRYLAQEYEEGLLLFNVMNEEVWKRAIEDTVGLKRFYETHLDSFRAGPRVVVYEFDSRDSADLAMVRRILLQHKDSVQIARTKADSLIRSLKLAVQGTKIILPADDQELGKQLYEQPLYTATPIAFHPGGYWHFYYLIEKREPGVLPYEEAQPKAITLYQQELEAQWIQTLRKRYPYKVNEKLLRKICQ